MNVMMRMVSLTMFISSLLPATASAFNVSTHRKMNESAITSDDQFNLFLQTDIGFLHGHDQQILGKRVITWLSDGGEHEDDWFSPSLAGGLAPGRFNRHFHDPLQPWTSAGLGHGVFDSAIIWMQEQQGWSWQETRDFYYAALTSSDPSARDQSWANTLRGVGHVMHLTEDAAQPAHVRNDQHAGGYLCHSAGGSCFGSFEYWASENPSQAPLTGGGGFDPDILSHPTGYSQAPVPVARLIDTDTYDGSFVVFGPFIGIAEYTNANFFSEDTISNSHYPHPDLTALVPTTWTVPGNGELRQYYAKGAGDGVPVNPVVAASVFDDVASLLNPPTYSVDERVWQVYANILIPKAVDYAQGALNYFFRGKIDFVADPSAPNTYLIKNLGSEPMSGTFELYYDDMNGNRRPVLGAQWPASLASQGDVQVTATLPPAGSSGKYTLVFHGDMGEEKASNGGLGAVVGKAVRTSSFLLLDTSGFSDSYIGYNGWVSNYWGSTWSAYRSDFVDRGWKRLGGQRTYNEGNPFGTFTGGCAVDDHSAFLWNEADSIALLDGGASLIPTPAGFSSVPQALDAPLSVACLGGSELLFTYGIPQQAEFGTWLQLGVAYSSDVGATAQSRQDDGGGLLTYVGNGTVLLQPGGTALLRSTDKGLTWSDVDPTFDGERLSAYDPTDPNSDRLDFSVMAWNHVEGDGSVVLANGFFRHDGLERNDSFWRSTDDGNSWQFLPTAFVDGYAPLYTFGFDSVAMSPQGEVLASFEAFEGTWGSQEVHSRVVRSLDAGETWQLAELPEPMDRVVSYTTMGLNVGSPYYSVVHAPAVVVYWPQ